MIAAAELDRLMQQALADKTAEPAFFRALLDATVYAHVPRHDRSGRLRFIQFTLPDGLTVLPFFSELAQANAATGSSARVVAATGRQLFALTRGATLMLNPNQISCVLYPEEVAALLDHGEMAIVEKIDTGGQDLWIGPVRSAPPSWLIDRLIALYARLESVEAAYLAELASAEAPERRGLLVAAAVPAQDAERVARATTTELQRGCDALQIELDFTAFEPGHPPDWLAEAEIVPFYVRARTSRPLPDAKGVH